MMQENAEVILNQVLLDRKSEAAPEASMPDFFEIFVAEQATKRLELTYEEIEAGIVDGEHDGGIDSFYTFVNDEIVSEEVNFPVPKQSPQIEVFIIQSKSGKGFTEDPINKLISSLSKLLSLSESFEKLTQYNSDVKERADIFRRTYKKLAAKFPSLRINILYATTKSTDEIHQNTRIKAADLEAKVKALFDEATINFEFWGAKEILAIARQRPNQTFQLSFDQHLNGSNGYVALVKLSDFYRFLCGGGDKLRQDLFEANVRDYQGSTEVNQEISATLGGDKSRDFWWFNNGVTVLSSRATSAGQIITIENPQIVNGLQTSSEIGRFFSENLGDDTRSVMVKVVASEDEEVRDKIIKATNSQNQVPPASLRATDRVQRDIEHHLKSNGLFYDRRKNYYKNDGKPANSIISISLLAQAVMTLFRGEPDNARARPSSLIKEDSEYNSIFAESFPLDAYFVAAKTIRSIELRLKIAPNLSARDRNNLRFYVLYWVCAIKAKSIALSPQRIAKLKGLIQDSEIDEAILVVYGHFVAEGATDQVAKGPIFRMNLKSKLQEIIKDYFKTQKNNEIR